MVSAPDLGTIATTAEGSIPEAAEATSPAEVVESAPAEGVESAPQTPVETATEPTPPPEPTAEQVRNSQAFKDALYQETQAIKDRSEAQAQKNLEGRQRQWLASGEYISALSQVVNPETGSIEIPKAQKLVDAIQIAADVEAGATAIDTLRSLMPADATLTVADQNRIDRARSLEDKLKINYELAVNAGVAAKAQEIRKSALADARRELAAAQKTADLKAAELARGQQPAPTSGIPAGVNTAWASQAEIDTAHMEGRLSSAQVTQLRRNGTYSRLPYLRE